MFNEISHKVKTMSQDSELDLELDADAAEQAAAGTKAFVGYLLISRCLVEHEVVGFGRPGKPADPKLGCYSHSEAWQYLLMQAAFKPRTRKIGKTTYNLERGELVVSERFLAAKWNWTYKSVRGFVTKLRAQSMLEKGAFTGRKIPTLTICNYDKYQAASDFVGAINEGAKANKPLKKGDKKKECLVKKEESIIDGLRPSHPTEDRAAAPAVPAAPPMTDKARAKAEAVTQAFEVWAKVAAEYKFPACKSVSDKRRKAMGQRLEQVGGDVTEFEQILRREISASEFLRGKVKPRPGSGFRQFEMTIDFVLQPSSWDKFIDGAYSRKPGAVRSTQQIDVDRVQADAAASIALTKQIAEQARKQSLDRLRSNHGR